MIFVAMSTGALAGTPIGGVFIRTSTLPNFEHLILFSVRPSLSSVLGVFLI
jgi:hypothetical protein